MGHGTITSVQFLALLGSAGVATVVDIRRYPGSRRHPHFGRDAMASWLDDAGVEYRCIGSLGGRRRPKEGSPNTAWRNEQFAAYADHMATEEFAEGMGELLHIADRRPTAVMCSEAVWWRCHRRLVADHLVLVERQPVVHVFHDGRSVAHEPMREACVVGHHLEYPADQGELPGL